MTPKPWPLSAGYVEFARISRELHQFFVEGREESPEADEVREASEGPWHALNETERARAAGLSGDLGTLVDPQPDPEPMNPQAQSKLNEFYEARERGDWDRALALLWRWGKYVSPPLLAYLRGTVWRGAGDRESAALFFEHAHRLEPENLEYFIGYLKSADPSAVRRDIDRILDRPADLPATVVISAAAAAATRLQPGPSPEDSRRYAAILGEVLNRPVEADSSLGPGERSVGYGFQGIHHQFAGDTRAAIESYTKGLADDPDAGFLLAARGLLEYGSNPRAIVDLERATRLGVDLVWPYFALAGDRFRERRFQECLDLCVIAQRFDAPDSVKGLLAEWTAVARAESEPPPATAGEAFAEAVRTPDDLRALVPFGALFQGQGAA